MASKRQRKKKAKRYSLSPSWGGTAKTPAPEPIDTTPEQTQTPENGRIPRFNYTYWDSMQTDYTGDDSYTIGEANFWGLYERLMVLRESDAPFIIEKTDRLIALLENEFARNEQGLYERLSHLTPEDVTSIDDWVVDSGQKTGGFSDSRFVSFYSIITGTSASVMTAMEFGE